MSLPIRICLSAVSQRFDIDGDIIKNKEIRFACVARARQLVCYLSNTLFSVSYSAIARELRLSSSTVLHGIQRIEDLRDDPKFEALVTDLERTANSLKEAWEAQAHA